MSGYKCPLCRHLFVNGPLLTETRHIRINHFVTIHPLFGVINGETVHCPIIGCHFICPTLEDFEYHCERRHYDEGGDPHRCKDCPKESLPFMSEIGLIRHEYHGHGKDRYGSVKKQNGETCKRPRARMLSVEMSWIIRKSNGYSSGGGGDGKRSMKKIKYK